MLTIIFIAFFSGILTVLAPCVLPLLPVILGGSLAGQSKKRPYIIIASLIVSLLLFTLILKASTILIDVDPMVWEYVSGGLLILFSFTLIFPKLWSWIMIHTGLEKLSQNSLENANTKEGIWGPIALGAALGPVFSSCNPTYTVLLATILPVSLTMGLVGLTAYFIGLGLVLLVITHFGRSIIGRFAFFTNPRGLFRKTLGVIILIVGLLIVTGTIKKLEAYVIEKNIFINTQMIDDKLNSIISPSESMCHDGKCRGESDNRLKQDLGVAPELSGIDAWINSDPLTMESLHGKVVLIDFWTYSCINCQRTQPYLNSWYDKYEKDGLVIIGVHAPEFAFEKLENNVREASQKAGIKYPIALDNDFVTWNAYANRYWPAKYLIDQNGNIVYKHFGEGAYEETENKIVEFLNKASNKAPLSRGEAKGGFINVADTESNVNPPALQASPLDRGATETITPETYLGSARAKNYFLHTADGVLVRTFTNGILDFSLSAPEMTNQWSIGGKWNVQSEYIQAVSQALGAGVNNPNVLELNFSAKKVFLVVSSESKNGTLEIRTLDMPGGRGNGENPKIIRITEDGLYTVFESESFQSDASIRIIASPGLRLHAFTFGS